MAKQSNRNRQTQQAGPGGRPQAGSRPRQGTSQKGQNPVRKAFTVVICVVVALSLMLPVTGIGMASCSSSAQDQQAQEAQQVQEGQAGQDQQGQQDQPQDQPQP
jgi:predicted metalloprotease